MRVKIGGKPGFVKVDENNRATEWKEDGSFKVYYAGDNNQVRSFYTTHDNETPRKGVEKRRRSAASYHTNYD